MVMTRPMNRGPGAPPGPHGPPGPPRPPGPSRRRVQRARGLPGGRAVVGGLLVALAGVGTLVAWQQASGTPDRAYAVADRPILPGEPLAPGDVRLVPVDLPAGVSGAAFTDAGDLAGRVALGPIAEGELVQAGQLSGPGAPVPTAEVSFALARDRAVDGRLRPGDLVDVFVTYDRGTEAVAEGIQVVTVSDGGATFSSGAELTVTLALTDPATRRVLIQAVRAGEVTLVRSTHLTGATPPRDTEAPPGESGGDAPAGEAGEGAPPGEVDQGVGGTGTDEGQGASVPADGSGD
jgi:Flp pilus assembly protein CpaB